MVNNLIEGKPLRLLFFLVMPTVVGNLFQQFYNMVDSMVMRRLVGENALAVAESSPLVVFLSVVIAVDMSMGCTVVISQSFGAGKILEMKITVSTAPISLRIIGLIIMGIGEIVAGPLLISLGTNPGTVAGSLTYLRICFGGTVLLFLYNSLNGIYNALGDSQTPLKSLIVSVLTNIVLDLLFTIQFNTDVADVTWTTLITQGMCAVFFSFVLITHPRKLENKEASRGKAFTFLDRPPVERTARMDMPSTLQQSIASIGMMLMQGLVNSYGKVFVAGYTAATKIDTLATVPNMNFPNTMPSYAAQNIGAGKTGRVKQGYKANTFVVAVFSLTVTSIIFLFRPQLLGLFLKQGFEGSAMSYGLSYMETISVSYILIGVLFTSSGPSRGASGMGASMLSSMVNLFSRTVIAYLLAHFIDSSAMWRSIPTRWAIGVLFSFLRVRNEKWMARRLVG